MNDKDEKRGVAERLRGWFIDILGEGRKIIWPSRQELVKQTGTVIFTSALFGVVILIMNGVFAECYSAFVRFLG